MSTQTNGTAQGAEVLPPADYRDRPSWHELDFIGPAPGRPVHILAQWEPPTLPDLPPHWYLFSGSTRTPEEAYRFGYRYKRPVVFESDAAQQLAAIQKEILGGVAVTFMDTDTAIGVLRNERRAFADAMHAFGDALGCPADREGILAAIAEEAEARGRIAAREHELRCELAELRLSLAGAEDAASDTLALLTGLVQAAAAQFALYAMHHAAKGGAEANDKAATNDAWAAVLRQAAARAARLRHLGTPETPRGA